jgi:hypothetical protein
MLQITARRSRRSHSISRDRPTSSIARQTVDRRAAVSKHERRSRTGVFRRRPGPGGGSARPTCAATEPAGLRDRNRPPCACNGALHAAQPCRSRALVRICNPGFASGTDLSCPDDRCSTRAGDIARARAEIAVLDSFAPGFIASLFRGENPVFTRRETWSTSWKASASRDFRSD